MENKRPNDHRSRELLRRYLAGEADADERSAVDTWYRLFIDTAPTLPTHEPVKVINRTGFLRKYRWWAVAASMLLVLSIGTLFFRVNEQSRQTLAVAHSISTDDYRKRVELPDGSVVMLNVHSQLEVPADFNAENRAVTLTGEAFFDVAKVPGRPFRVQSGDLTTRVLGTSFNIEGYREDRTVKIAVVSGTVEVLKASAGRLDSVLTDGITENQTLTFRKDDGSVAIRTEESRLISAWQTGELDISNLTLPEIGHKLARRFSRDLVIDTTLSDRTRYTIHFTNENLSEILPVLAEMTRVNFEEKGGSLLIRTN